MGDVVVVADIGFRVALAGRLHALPPSGGSALVMNIFEEVEEATEGSAAGGGESSFVVAMASPSNTLPKNMEDRMGNAEDHPELRSQGGLVQASYDATLTTTARSKGTECFLFGQRCRERCRESTS